MQRSFFIGSKLGLRREFFSKIPNFWVWVDKLALKFWGAFWVFSDNLSAPILVLTVSYPCFPLFLKKKLSFYIQISDIYLGLGFEFEFGLKKIRDLAIVSPQSMDQRLKIQFDHRICSL